MSLPPSPPPLNLPPQVILAPGRWHGELLAQHLSAEGALRHRVILGSVDLYLNSNTAVLSSFLGCDAASLVASAILNAGVKQVFFLGIAAGISLANNPPAIGDIVVPQFYLYDDCHAKDSWKHRRIDNRGRLPQPIYEGLLAVARVHQGGHISVRSLEQETAQFVTFASDQGVVSIDMELGAVANLCSEAGIVFHSVLIVSDLVSSEWERGFSSSTLAQAVRRVIAVIGDYATSQIDTSSSLRGKY